MPLPFSTLVNPWCCSGQLAGCFSLFPTPRLNEETLGIMPIWPLSPEENSHCRKARGRTTVASQCVLHCFLATNDAVSKKSPVSDVKNCAGLVAISNFIRNGYGVTLLYHNKDKTLKKKKAYWVTASCFILMRWNLECIFTPHHMWWYYWLTAHHNQQTKRPLFGWPPLTVSPW